MHKAANTHTIKQMQTYTRRPTPLSTQLSINNQQSEALWSLWSCDLWPLALTPEKPVLRGEPGGSLKGGDVPMRTEQGRFRDPKSWWWCDDGIEVDFSVLIWWQTSLVWSQCKCQCYILRHTWLVTLQEFEMKNLPGCISFPEQKPMRYKFNQRSKSNQKCLWHI